MRSIRVIHVISAHAGGEVGDVIVGGVAPPPGETLWEQREFFARDETLRNFMVNEPRGGVFHHVNLLVPPKDRRHHPTGRHGRDPAAGLRPRLDNRNAPALACPRRPLARGLPRGRHLARRQEDRGRRGRRGLR